MALPHAWRPAMVRSSNKGFVELDAKMDFGYSPRLFLPFKQLVFNFFKNWTLFLTVVSHPETLR